MIHLICEKKSGELKVQCTIQNRLIKKNAIVEETSNEWKLIDTSGTQ